MIQGDRGINRTTMEVGPDEGFHRRLPAAVTIWKPLVELEVPMVDTADFHRCIERVLAERSVSMSCHTEQHALDPVVQVVTGKTSVKKRVG